MVKADWATESTQVSPAMMRNLRPKQWSNGGQKGQASGQIVVKADWATESTQVSPAMMRNLRQKKRSNGGQSVVKRVVKWGSSGGEESGQMVVPPVRTRNLR